MAVLVLLILMVAQIMSGATRTTGQSRQRLDADSEARMIFGRMAGDFARLVNRKDIDFLFIDKQAGNDQLFFFSEAPAVTPTAASATDPTQPVALVGYRISTDYQLERLGKGLTWGGTPPDGAVFRSSGPSWRTANAATLFEPGLTARIVWPWSVSVTAPCEASPPSVPSPPADTLPAGVSAPSAERS